MSSFLTNKSNASYEVFKDGNQLLKSRFIQIVLHSGLIIFIHDLLSDSVVLTPGTNIKLPTGATKISFVASGTGAAYEIEVNHSLAARVLFNEILVAAGQKESKLVDEASAAVASMILPPIRQLTGMLEN